MKNPTSKQFKKVIANFDKVLPLATKRGHLNMLEGELAHEGNVCGTPMCHGGWYAVANNIYYSSNLGFLAGAQSMAKDLGFFCPEELVIWARGNTDLWGNNSGGFMFSCDIAFNKAKTLRGIRNWWARVHNRTCPNAKPVGMV